LKQNNTNDRTAPISNKIPIANPAFPAVLIPPELELVGRDVALAADTVEVVAAAALELVVVSAKSDESVGTTFDLDGVITVGILFEWEVVASTGKPVFEAPSSGGDDAMLAPDEVVIAGPKVE
jgi:hypothetical protein